MTLLSLPPSAHVLMARGYVFNIVMVTKCWRSSPRLIMTLPIINSISTVIPKSIKCNFLFRQFSQYRGSFEPPPNIYIKLASDNSGYPYAISEEEEKIITEENLEAKFKLQELLLMLYLKRERGDRLPQEISIKDVKELLSLKENEVDYMLKLIHIREARRKFSKHEQVKVKDNLGSSLLGKQENLASSEHPYLSYNSYENSLFPPILKTEQSRYYNNILSHGLLFGQNVVFDCSYDEYMSLMQIRETASGVHNSIRLNRRNRRPFAISLCCVPDSSRVLQHLQKINPAIGYDVPIHIHSCSYLDLFQREDIVYLSPHVNHELEYHPDDVYVIGALGDDLRQLSLKKARLEGVRCAKLPVGFQQLLRRSFVLTIREVFGTLLSKKNTGVWSHASKTKKDLRFPKS